MQQGILMDTTQTHQFSERSTPKVAAVFTDDSKHGTVTLGPLGFPSLISTLTLRQQHPNSHPGTNPTPSTVSPHEAPQQVPAHGRNVSCLQHVSLLTHWACTQVVGTGLKAPRLSVSPHSWVPFLQSSGREGKPSS